jgi:ribosome assembly protein 1
VLRQAWQDRLRPILVLNKFDRLITELKLSPLEAYHQLAQLIEQVNAVMGSFFAHDRMEDDLRWREERDQRLATKKEQKADEAYTSASEEEDFQEKDDEDLYFAPDRGNVVFASAIDGWGFRVGKFAQLFATKLGIKESNLRRVLWGDFYLDPKTKRVISHKHLRGRALKPLFVQIVLENIWAVYDAVVINPYVNSPSIYIHTLTVTCFCLSNPDKVPKIVSALGLQISSRELNSRDSRQLLSTIFSKWLSLSTCLIQAIIDIVPSPIEAQRTRVIKMLYPDLHEDNVTPRNKMEEDLFACNASPGSNVVAYVSKMFAVPTKELPENKRQGLSADEMRRRASEARALRQANSVSSPVANATPEPGTSRPDPADEDEEVSSEGESMLGFARIYSGTIRVGQTVHAILPKYNNDRDASHPTNVKYRLQATVQALYTMMGRELVPVQAVQAGNVFAVRGLEGIVWRNATLCATGTSVGTEQAEVNTDTTDSAINLGALHNAVRVNNHLAVSMIVNIAYTTGVSHSSRSSGSCIASGHAQTCPRPEASESSRPMCADIPAANRRTCYTHSGRDPSRSKSLCGSGVLN